MSKEAETPPVEDQPKNLNFRKALAIYVGIMILVARITNILFYH